MPAYLLPDSPESSTAQLAGTAEAVTALTAIRGLPLVSARSGRVLTASALAGAFAAGYLAACDFQNSNALTLSDSAWVEESSTSADNSFHQRSLLYSIINRVWSWAAGEQFEAGIDNSFTLGIRSLIKTFGSVAVDALAEHIRGHLSSEEMVIEALKAIGDSGDRATLVSRMNALITFLKSDRDELREGALLGLELLGERAAVPYLKAASEGENDSFLRREFARVVNALENRNALHTQKSYT